jgi:uncharacterized protein YndB with AHSA1/START domain
MAEPKVLSETSLQLERIIAAPPEEVFDAWIRSEIMTRWYAPSDEFTTVVHRADAKVGGGYRIEMRKPDGTIHFVHGTYEELTRPKRLVFTWEWETNLAEGNTLVTVDLAPEGKGTKLTLTHERFPDAKTRDSHAQGWIGCLDHLARTIGH